MIENPNHPAHGEVQVAQLTQGHLENFYKHLRENGITAAEKTLNEYAGELVRAAVACAWFPGLTMMDVNNMTPWKVMWLFEWVKAFLASATEIDPNSFRPLSNVPTSDNGHQSN